MINKIGSMVGAVIIVISTGLGAQESRYYVGASLEQRQIKMVDGLGAEVFNKRLPQINFLLGVKLNDCFNLEAGWLTSQRVTRTSFSSRTPVLGAPFNPGEWTVSENTLALKGAHVDLSARSSLWFERLYAYGSVGLVALTLKARHKPLLYSGLPPLTLAEIQEDTRYFSSRKIIPRCKVGVGYLLSPTVAIKLSLGYEMTSKFKKISAKDSALLKLSSKNSLLYGIGLNFSY